MNAFRLLNCALASALLAAGAPPSTEKLLPIFDGKTLDGWEQCNGSATYRVEDGAIVGTTAKGSPNSFLCTKKTYGDFILEFEVKNDPELNTGVQLRGHRYAKPTSVLTENKGKKKREHPAGRVYGYQAEIANEASGASGGIYDEARRGWIADIKQDPVASKALRDNQWNKYRVVAIGDSIKTWVNGVACANLVDPVDQEGFLALQVHQFGGAKPTQVRWRNIRLADLGRHAWKPIWDGKSLSGWSKYGGGEWEIRDGALRGTQTPASQQRGFLLSRERFKDFTARLQYKILRGNSGFFFRMKDPENAPVYEVEIDATRDAGGLIEPRDRGWMVRTGPTDGSDYYRAGDWNELVVSAHARRVVIHVNGVKTVDLANDPGSLEGLFGLQLNPKQDLEVLFKNIEILRPGK